MLGKKKAEIHHHPIRLLIGIIKTSEGSTWLPVGRDWREVRPAIHLMSFISQCPHMHQTGLEDLLADTMRYFAEKCLW
jgi:hypothetical protein